MGMTEFGVGHALAVQHWATDLAVEADKQIVLRKFMGTGADNIIVVRKELNKKAGEKITFGLEMKLTGDGVEGDNIIEGTSGETALDYYDDAVFISQRRKGTKSKGRMSEQRVPYPIRERGKRALGIWFGEDYDEQLIMYLSGARGIDTSYHSPLGYAGRAGNAFNTPSSTRRVYGGNASSVATIDAMDKMDLDVVEKLVAKLETTDPMIQPAARIDGEIRFVLLMHTYVAYDLRRSISQNDWLEIHKATDNAKSPIYMNALGEYAGIVLQKHRNVVRFDSTTGCATGVTACRNLLLGAQAAVIAWGGEGGPGRYTWNEETDDRGNALAITAGSIYGVTKCVFNSIDFGVIAVDTWAKDPTA